MFKIIVLVSGSGTNMLQLIKNNIKIGNLIFLFSDLFKILRTITIGIIQSVLVSFIIVAIFKASVL